MVKKIVKNDKILHFKNSTVTDLGGRNCQHVKKCVALFVQWDAQLSVTKKSG